MLDWPEAGAVVYQYERSPVRTLKMAQRLEAAGFAAPQAAGASEALAEAITGSDLATKRGLQATK
jgi:hypothetical protein